jgi:hypothetical protein
MALSVKFPDPLLRKVHFNVRTPASKNKLVVSMVLGPENIILVPETVSITESLHPVHSKEYVK